MKIGLVSTTLYLLFDDLQLLLLVKFISAWFLDEDTRMNPNLDFAQMQRGPDGQVGSRTGVLYVKHVNISSNNH